MPLTSSRVSHSPIRQQKLNTVGSTHLFVMIYCVCPVCSHVCSVSSRPAGVCRGRESAVCVPHDAGGGFLHGPHQQQHWRQGGGAQTRCFSLNVFILKCNAKQMSDCKKIIYPHSNHTGIPDQSLVHSFVFVNILLFFVCILRFSIYLTFNFMHIFLIVFFANISSSCHKRISPVVG